MNDLREMLDVFRNKYACIHADGCAVSVRMDNELIYRILSGMMDRIEAIEQRQKVEDEEDVEDVEASKNAD